MSGFDYINKWNKLIRIKGTVIVLRRFLSFECTFLPQSHPFLTQMKGTMIFDVT